MKDLQSTVRDHLGEHGINFRFHPESNLFEFGINGENGNWKMYILCDEDRRLLEINAVCPVYTPDRQRLPMCELLARINNSILLGKFSMDFEDGEVTLKTNSVYKETEMSEECLEILLYSNYQTLDRFLPAIMSVNYRHNDPVLAFIEAREAA